MKKKKTSKRKAPAKTFKVPDWALDDAPIPNKPLTKQDLDELDSYSIANNLCDPRCLRHTRVILALGQRGFRGLG
jgi:hypothetical protein